MIHTIREAFNELLEENHWMDDETRAVAKEKANAMNERIGYPELLTNPEELNNEYVQVRYLINLKKTIHSKYSQQSNMLSLVMTLIRRVV